MNKDQKIQAIREACTITNAEKFDVWKYKTKGEKILVEDIKVTLADVLLAINYHGQVWVDSQYPVLTIDMKTYTNLKTEKKSFEWVLSKDSLEDQEESTINFIHELIQK